MSHENHHFDTLAVHAGEPGARPRPTAVPIYLSSSYVYDTTEELDAAFTGAGPFYSRNGNPSCAAFEAACAALEGAEGAVAFGSGMAALHGALLASGVQSGETVLAARELYGVTVRLLREIFAALGVETHYVDATDTGAVRTALDEWKPKALLVESISNPRLSLVDIAALAEHAHNAGAALIVDNTFASPWLLQPHALGADMVMHSATKYLGGHGDAMGGVVTASGDWVKPLRAAQVVAGAVLSPFEATMLARGIKTLALRMERHNTNALAVAQWLDEQPGIQHVYYPGLPSHPQHGLARQLFQGRGFGGMVSFTLKGAGRAEVARFLDALRLALPGPTLGDVTTLVMLPVIASHRALSAEQRANLGITDNMVRLSVGIEDAGDIIADLAQALAGVST